MDKMDLSKHLKARFKLTQNKAPDYREGKKHKHFKISLSVDEPDADYKVVVYELDPTYYNSIRETEDWESGFKTDITSYGDYPLTVKVLKGSDSFTIKTRLSDLLARGHTDSLNDPSIQQALDYIKEH